MASIFEIGQASVDLSAKSNYRILVLGASATGKTQIINQFLYDKFATKHMETMDDMYRGEFEDGQGKLINFDIQVRTLLKILLKT